MDPKFQTSFIPQKPIVTGSNFSPSSPGFRSINIFNIIATVAFVACFLAYGGIFAYKQVLNGQIKEADGKLKVAKNAFEPEKIYELIDASNRIESTRKLLEDHVAVSQLFDLLQNETLARVQFDNFTYNKKDTNLIITMDGKADGYNTIAAQSTIFSESKFIKDAVFSDFDLSQTGNVTFKLTAVIDSSLVSYKNAIAKLESASEEDASTTGDTTNIDSLTP